MNSLQNLFVINPDIEKKCKKYIWFNRNSLMKARGLLEFFIRKNIYIDGFVTDCCEDAGVYVWNKKVFFIESIDEKNALIFSEKSSQRYSQVQSIFSLQPGINKQNVVVYGAGNDGLHLLHTANDIGIVPRMFIDSNCDKVGKELEGTPIRGKEILKKLEDDVTIVIAADKAYMEIDQIIAGDLPHTERYHYNYRELDCEINKRIPIGQNEIFWTHYIGRAKEIIKEKKIFLYGTSDRNRKIAKIYELLDFCIEGYIVDEPYENVAQLGKRTISIEEIIYEDNIFILISQSDYDRVSATFEDLGLIILEDFGVDNPFKVCYIGMRDEILDVNLGHSFVGKQGICGFSILGTNTAYDKKIAVLGASTTEGELYPFKSWPEFLFEKIKIENVTIYNGSVAKYTSAHELIKLLRDIVFIKPDLVIVYDGALDMLMQSETENPFTFDEMQQALDFVYKYKDEIWLDHFSESVLPYTGIKPKIDLFDRWLGNIKKMRAICESEQIKFISFFQPTLFYKTKKSKDEKGLLWSSVNDCNIYDRAEEFKRRIKQISNEYGYIYDLSDIFDDERNIYMDECHVFEKGNQIIADAIYEIVKANN